MIKYIRCTSYSIITFVTHKQYMDQSQYVLVFSITFRLLLIDRLLINMHAQCCISYQVLVYSYRGTYPHYGMHRGSVLTTFINSVISPD